jgi:hypothetical protein
LDPGSDTSVEAWLEQTSYPYHRKLELLEKWNACSRILNAKKHFKVQSFMKDETYPEYKHARGINSRSDEFKCRVGPIFRLIEKVLFKQDWFVKRIPVHLRPEYILGRLFKNGSKYVATDYTAFESMFVKELMQACEFQLYDYMTSELPEHEEFMTLMDTVLAGENVCVNKNFTVKLEATRMSGEMCTSLGNGFSNLMFMLFICEMNGNTDVVGVVEGDDGLFTMNGEFPTSEDFAKLGLIIKMDVHESIETASFCGLVFDREDLINVTDPREVLAGFGWGASKYSGSRKSKLLTLLRCKALSVAHQYPGCPILGSLAQYALRVSRSHDVRNTILNWQNTYEREQLLEVLGSGKRGTDLYVIPPPRTRFLVEKLYGISVEHQLHIEQYLDSLMTVQHLSDPILTLYMAPSWTHYWDNYVLSEESRNPLRVWPQADAYQLENPLFDAG